MALDCRRAARPFTLRPTDDRRRGTEEVHGKLELPGEATTGDRRSLASTTLGADGTGAGPRRGPAPARHTRPETDQPPCARQHSVAHHGPRRGGPRDRRGGRVRPHEGHVDEPGGGQDGEDEHRSRDGRRSTAPLRRGTIRVLGPGSRVVSVGKGGRDPRNINRLLVRLKRVAEGRLLQGELDDRGRGRAQPEGLVHASGSSDERAHRHTRVRARGARRARRRRRRCARRARDARTSRCGRRTAAPGDPVLWTVLVPSEQEPGRAQVELADPEGRAAVLLRGRARLDAAAAQRTPTARCGRSCGAGGPAATGWRRFASSPRHPSATGAIAWKAIQTYGDGDVVRWIGSPGSETPASVTTISRSARRENAGGEAGEAGTAVPPAAAADEAADGNTVPTGSPARSPSRRSSRHWRQSGCASGPAGLTSSAGRGDERHPRAARDHAGDVRRACEPRLRAVGVRRGSYAALARSTAIVVR